MDEYRWYWIRNPDGTVRPASDREEWLRVFQDVDGRRIRVTTFVGTGGDEVRVSTVFLGLNHGYGDEPPVLWETMIFGGALDEEEYQTRLHERARCHCGALARRAPRVSHRAERRTPQRRRYRCQ